MFRKNINLVVFMITFGRPSPNILSPFSLEPASTHFRLSSSVSQLLDYLASSSSREPKFVTYISYRSQIFPVQIRSSFCLVVLKCYCRRFQTCHLLKREVDYLLGLGCSCCLQSSNPVAMDLIACLNHSKFNMIQHFSPCRSDLSFRLEGY